MFRLHCGVHHLDSLVVGILAQYHVPCPLKFFPFERSHPDWISVLGTFRPRSPVSVSSAPQVRTFPNLLCCREDGRNFYPFGSRRGQLSVVPYPGVRLSVFLDLNRFLEVLEPSPNKGSRRSILTSDTLGLGVWVGEVRVSKTGCLSSQALSTIQTPLVRVSLRID